ncbi:MAG: molybdopterin-dependent oxidoreductase [Bacillota bacterium]
MASFINKVNELNLSRRSFLKASAVATASLPLVGCGNSLIKSATENVTGEEGEWITAACWHNCGGRCLNKALVVDGIVVRQKTDDTHMDSPEFPQQRACLRGRSQRQQVFGADRLKYPMKRKNWAPGGGNKELRGQDEWVRISWEEALDIVASELKRNIQEHGNRSIFSTLEFGSLANSEIAKLLTLVGGCVTHSGTRSWGTWKATPRLIGEIPEPMPGLQINDRFDLLNCKTVIMLGANPAWSAISGTPYYTRLANEAGAKFIFIDPFYNDTASLVDGEWIPVRPATDTAFLLGVAYVMITTDDPVTNPIIDWEFLKANTVGFDEESMPEDADPKDNFKDYVLGTYDGVPKTPEWASKICGAKPDQIRYLANELRMHNKVALLTAYAPARNKNADNLPQLVMTIGAMGGHMGKSGHCTGVSSNANAFNGGPRLVQPGGDGIPPYKNPVDDSIRDAVMWPAILDGEYSYVGSLDGGPFLPAERRKLDIKVIYNGGVGNSLQSRDGMNKGIKAYRKVDFVVTHAQFLNTQAKYSDVVLPVTTWWERLGGFLTGGRETLFMYSQVVKPLYEAKDDAWVAEELAKLLGVDPKKLYPFDEKQQFFNKIAGSTVVTDDGKGMEPLVTITNEDIAEWGVQGKPQKGRIGLKELQKKGVYQVERHANDNFGYIAFSDPPAAVAGATQEKFFDKSKIKIYSKEFEDTINAMGFSKIRGIPTYIEPEDGYEKTFSDWDNQIKGEFPFQVMNPHYLRRSHTVFDNIRWLQEAWPSPLFINENDAKAHGISTGDTVLLTSPHGQTLRTALLTQRFIPGVIGLPHGSWPDIDEKTGIDTGGADNMLCGAISTGQGTSGWNTAICNIEKYKGTPLVPDVQRPQRIIF